jgi:hypothetical protein
VSDVESSVLDVALVSRRGAFVCQRLIPDGAGHGAILPD